MLGDMHWASPSISVLLYRDSLDQIALLVKCLLCTKIAALSVHAQHLEPAQTVSFCLVLISHDHAVGPPCCRQTRK